MLAGELGSAFFRSCAGSGSISFGSSSASAWTSPPVKKPPVPELCQLSSVYGWRRECGRSARALGIRDRARRLPRRTFAFRLSGADGAATVVDAVYWTWDMRDAVESFTRAGGNLAIFGANTSWWPMRLSDNGGRAGAPAGERHDGTQLPARRRMPESGHDRDVRRVPHGPVRRPLVFDGIGSTRSTRPIACCAARHCRATRGHRSARPTAWTCSPDTPPV